MSKKQNQLIPDLDLNNLDKIKSDLENKLKNAEGETKLRVANKELNNSLQRELERQFRIIEKEMVEEIKKLFAAGMTVEEFNANAKGIIIRQTNEIKDKTIKSIAEENKDWIKFHKKGKGDYEPELIVPKMVKIPVGNSKYEEIATRIPYTAKKKAEKINVIETLNMDKIAGRFYGDVKNIFMEWLDRGLTRQDLEIDTTNALTVYGNHTKTILRTLKRSLLNLEKLARGEMIGLDYIYFEHGSPCRKFCKYFEWFVMHKEVWNELDNINIEEELGIDIGYSGRQEHSHRGNGQGLPIIFSGGGFNCKGSMNSTNRSSYEEFLTENPNLNKKLYAFIEKHTPKYIPPEPLMKLPKFSDIKNPILK